jgi:hypothetical protein
VTPIQTSYPWAPILETGRDEELVATAREGVVKGSAAPLPDDLHPALLEALTGSGIEGLWSHQADALEGPAAAT